MSRFFDSRLADIIRKPVITEKATNAIDLNPVSYTHLTLPTNREV